MTDIKLSELPNPFCDKGDYPGALGEGASEDLWNIDQMNAHYLKGYNDALSAVRGNVPEGWQPIETAPKDGTAFLMCSRNWILTCHWHRFQHCWASCGPTYERLPHDEQPEYWMPLPSAPDSEGGK